MCAFVKTEEFKLPAYTPAAVKGKTQKKSPKKPKRQRPKARPQKKPTNRLGVSRVITRRLPLLSERGVAMQYGMGRTDGGSLTSMYAIADIVLTVSSSGSGEVLPVIGGANTVKLSPAMFNALNALGLLFDRARIVGLTFEFVPAAALTIPGAMVMYIDYRSDTAVTTIQQAVRTQGAVEFSPYQRNAHVIWRPQGPSDYEFAASTGTGGFNQLLAQTFAVFGTGLPASSLLGYVHVSAILEMTGRQTV